MDTNPVPPPRVPASVGHAITDARLESLGQRVKRDHWTGWVQEVASLVLFLGAVLMLPSSGLFGPEAPWLVPGLFIVAALALRVVAWRINRQAQRIDDLVRYLAATRPSAR
jgi:protein-S-isoprenylcysteine O-methyltransferase Ste14